MTIERHPAVPAHLYEQGNVTYFGIGSHAFAWNETRRISCEPARDLRPAKFGVPATIAGYTIRQIEVDGAPLLVAGAGVPAELFSEVSTFPQVLWPLMGQGKPVVFEVTAPPPPPGPAPFTGAFYGVTPFTPEELEQRRLEREKLQAQWERGLPDRALCDVEGCKAERRFDGDDSIAPRKWAQVTFVDEDGESEDFMLCEEHTAAVKAVIGA